MAARRKKSAPNGNNSHYYSGMFGVLEKQVDAGLLADLFSRIREAGVEATLPVGADPAVHRMLKRTGVVAEKTSDEAATKIAQELFRDMAEDLSKPAVQIGLLFRLYTSGMYGVMSDPVCGSTPRCSICGITKYCEYFSHTPANTAEQKLPPLQRFFRAGESALSDTELLALILGGSRPTSEHFAAADSLLKKFGSLRSLANTSCNEMVKLQGITGTTAVKVAAAGALHRMVSEETRIKLPLVRSGHDFFELYHHKLRDKKKEIFYVVFMDVQNRIIKDEEVSMGSLSSVQVNPREVFTGAVRESAAAVAFVHNHPSGDTRPSEADISLTKRLVESAQILGMKVLDHVIIGDGAYTSFFDEKLL